MDATRSSALWRTWLLVAIFLAGALTLLTIAAAIAVPVFMAAFIAAVLRSPVRGLMRTKLPRQVAAFLVIVMFSGLVVGAAVSLYGPASVWAAEVPKLVTKVEKKLYPLKRTIAEAQNTAEQIEKAADLGSNQPRPVVVSQPTLLQRLLDTSRAVMVQVVITVLLAFFMLAYPIRPIPDELIERMGERGTMLRDAFGEIEQKMSDYMGTMTVINLTVGALTGVIMYAFGLPSPVLWGAIAAVLGFVPYIGPILTAGAIAGVSILTFNDWPAILAPVGAYLVIHFIESELVTPMVIGRMMTLHPVAIVLSVLVWGWMWGLAGAFLAIPILVATMITIRAVVGREQSVADHAAIVSWMAPDRKTPRVRMAAGDRSSGQ